MRVVALPRIGKRTTQEEQHVKKTLIALLAGVVALTVLVGGALAKGEKKAADADICVLLPDPKSSVRWETQDRPALVTAFKAAEVSYVITNADGDAQKQKTQADQCLANGAKVVILVSLDAGSSIAIEKAAAAAGAQGDRVRPPGRSAVAPPSTSRSTARPSACCRARASSPA